MLHRVIAVLRRAKGSSQALCPQFLPSCGGSASHCCCFSLRLLAILSSDSAIKQTLHLSGTPRAGTVTLCHISLLPYKRSFELCLVHTPIQAIRSTSKPGWLDTTKQAWLFIRSTLETGGSTTKQAWPFVKSVLVHHSAL